MRTFEDMIYVAMENALRESERELNEVRRQTPKTLENMIRTALDTAADSPVAFRDAMAQNIIDRIHVALIAAVYAGHIEGDVRVVPKFNGIGADSYQHREEYMNYAANFVFPYNSEGKIESDTVFNEVSDYMWRNYCDPINKEEE